MDCGRKFALGEQSDDCPHDKLTEGDGGIGVVGGATATGRGERSPPNSIVRKGDGDMGGDLGSSVGREMRWLVPPSHPTVHKKRDK